MDPRQIPLRDLHLPEPIGWWPLAPGWWLLIGLAVIGAALLLRQFLRRRARAAARREALGRLAVLVDEYEQEHDAVSFAVRVSGLLRRTMLAYAPRSRVAGLTGEDWLAWLDRDLAHAQFVNGPGRALLELPYRAAGADVPKADVYGLVTAVRQRLATPVGGER